jgi:segregation and condensation protein B
LKGAGLFDGKLPSGFGVPLPSDAPGLTDDEEPLEAAGDPQEIWGSQGEEEGA